MCCVILYSLEQRQFSGTLIHFDGEYSCTVKLLFVLVTVLVAVAIAGAHAPVARNPGPARAEPGQSPCASAVPGVKHSLSAVAVVVGSVAAIEAEAQSSRDRKALREFTDQRIAAMEAQKPKKPIVMGIFGWGADPKPEPEPEPEPVKRHCFARCCESKKAHVFADQ